MENVVEPYALENARLLREQNELHKKLLLKNDEMDVTVRENKDQVNLTALLVLLVENIDHIIAFM